MHQPLKCEVGEPSQKENHCDECRRKESASCNFRRTQSESTHIDKDQKQTDNDCVKNEIGATDQGTELRHASHLCSKEFRMPSKLKVHLRTHTGEKPYVCALCQKGFSTGWRMQRHLRTHEYQRVLQCSHCPCSFSCISLLKRHVRQLHQADESLPLFNKKLREEHASRESAPTETSAVVVPAVRRPLCSSEDEIELTCVPTVDEWGEAAASAEDRAPPTAASVVKAFDACSRDHVDMNGCPLVEYAKVPILYGRHQDQVIQNCDQTWESAQGPKEGVQDTSIEADINVTANSQPEMEHHVHFTGSVPPPQGDELACNSNTPFNATIRFGVSLDKSCFDVSLGRPNNESTVNNLLQIQQSTGASSSKCDLRRHVLEKQVDRKRGSIENPPPQPPLATRNHPPPLLLCPVCSESFTHKSTFGSHIAMHRAAKPYSCNICLRSFPHQNSLNGHLWVHKGKASPYKCTLCPSTFPKQAALDEHLGDHVTEEVNSEFSVCKGDYATEERLHEDSDNLHHAENCPVIVSPMAVAGESGGATTIYSLSGQDMAGATGGMCLNEADVPQVKKEAADARLEPPRRRFSCHLCPKDFSQRGSLRDHLRTHSYGKSYQCHLCPQKFFYLSNMRRHVRRHAGEKMFRCKLCGVQFTRMRSLRDHMGYTHGRFSPTEPGTAQAPSRS